jgi:hypothetical protein
MVVATRCLGVRVEDHEAITEPALKATLVGDVIQMRIEKAILDAEPRDRVAPVLRSPTVAGGVPTLERFAKTADGEWELEKVLGVRGTTTVEIIVRRIAS